MKKKLLPVLLFASITVLWGSAPSAYAVDWQSISGKKITLFYPGQASWEWLLTDHEGAKYIKSGQYCRQCHDGMQSDMGQKLVSGALLENTPIKDKPGSIEVELKSTHDQNSLYLHLEWTPLSSPADKASPDYEAMASVMLDDGKVAEMTRGGCWAACHTDVDTMINANPSKKTDKYLIKSRSKMTRRGSGDIKSEADLNSLFKSGIFVEIWQARLNRNQPAKVSNGYILDSRHDQSPATVSADAEFVDGKWSITFSRPLHLNAPGHKTIDASRTYTLGISIHDGFVNGRRHYVSFGHTLRLNEGSADFVAQSQ